MKIISVTTLALMVALMGALHEASAAGADDRDTPAAPSRPLAARFTLDQQALLKELGIKEDFNVDTASSRTIGETEKSIIQSMIFDAVRDNAVFRGEDGSLYLRLTFQTGDASICLTDWQKNLKEIVRQKQQYGHLFGAQKA